MHHGEEKEYYYQCAIKHSSYNEVQIKVFMFERVTIIPSKVVKKMS